MRSRFPSASNISYSFGPGPLTPAIKTLIIANVVVFVARWLLLRSVPVDELLGLAPVFVLQGRVWQLVTYMFVHAGPTHLLFNMLALWMFGTELERMWGTKYFTKFYFVSGIGAGLFQVLLGILPFGFAANFYLIPVVGASGAIYGVLAAYALYFPSRPIVMFLLFPVPARYAVMIMGGLSLFFAMSGGGGIAHTAHLGGLVVGYLYLKRNGMHLLSEIQYRFLKWRINRMKRRFDVYSGGRANDVDRRIH
jgi:membrane associated rhomboid family serine protease